MVPRVGDRIGPYEVLGRLGSGGMGLVFSAWDSRLQREVAIKLLREEYATPGMRQRFLQEARAASRLNHPNICTIFDMGEQDGDPYMVMELLKGETIRARISRGSASSAEIIAVATEVADALIVAHGRGIIHRDIKPANIILVDKAGGRFQAKVLDFGLAKVERDGPESRLDLTSAGTTVGTVAYMSPEQARGEALDARSDLFSLGTVLYEMATGELPFQGATSALVFVQLLSQQPEPVREFNPEIPKDLEKIILTLLEKKRSDRFQSAADVVEALGRINAKKANKGFWGSNKPAKALGTNGDNRDQPPTLPPRPPTREAILESIHESRLNSKVSSPAPTPTPASGSSASALSAQTGETFLRPVKRVVTEDSSRPKSQSEVRAAKPAPPMNRPEAHPSAFSLFQAASSAAHRPAGSSSSNRIADLGKAASRPNTPVERPPARSSSGILPAAVVPRPAREAAPTQESLRRLPAQNEEPALATRAAAPERFAEAAVAATVTNEVERQPAAASRITSSRVSGKRFIVEQPSPVEDADDDANTGSGGKVLLLVLLCVGILGAGAWYKWGHKAANLGSTPASLLLASLQNRTGDTTLGGVFDSGLLLDLQQSPRLSVRMNEDLQFGAKAAGVSLTSDGLSIDDARKIASAAGDSLVGFGSIAQDGGTYTLSLRVVDAGSGSKVAEATATATSREQVVDAIDRLSSDIRLGLGESGDSISSSNVPLIRDASGSPDALQAYATADSLAAAGKTYESMLMYETVIKADPHFTQAYIALADIYRRQHADVESANDATHAQDSSANAGTRTQALAQASYALDRLGDPAQAVRVLTQLSSQYTADEQTLVAIAVAQRLARNYDAALVAAQSILQMAPFSREGRAEGERALIGLDRLDEASQMDQQGTEAGEGRPAITALLGYLNLPTPSTPAPSTADDQISTRVELAEVLDGEGQFAAGLAGWRDVIDRSHAVAGLASTARYALARAALNRSLAGDCATAQSLLREAITMPSGPRSNLDAGVSYALCGDLVDARNELAILTSSTDQNITAKSLFVPTLSAVLQWKSGNSEAAAGALENVRADQLWLATYLGGLVRIDRKEATAALGDLQPLTVHRGSVAMGDPEVLALGEFQTASVFDSRNGPIHFKNFLALWANADAGNAMVATAQAQTR
jgi:serine/threonine protein kinase/tetratricopeptide (TPR) repeat protein